MLNGQRVLSAQKKKPGPTDSGNRGYDIITLKEKHPCPGNRSGAMLKFRLIRANGGIMIRAVVPEDRARLLSILVKTGVFTSREIDVAMELIDIVLKNHQQEDYEIECLVDGNGLPLGYICHGPSPMTQGTFDLYWIAVDPGSQGTGVGSRLVDFLEKALRQKEGRMILADTSTVPQYEKTRRFYLRQGFEEVARIRDYYSPGNDRVTFCKRISR